MGEVFEFLASALFLIALAVVVVGTWNRKGQEYEQERQERLADPEAIQRELEWMQARDRGEYPDWPH